jgi:hypothetical protein
LIFSVVNCIGETQDAVTAQGFVVIASAVGAAVITSDATPSTIATNAAASLFGRTGFDRDVVMFSSSFPVTPLPGGSRERQTKRNPLTVPRSVVVPHNQFPVIPERG